MSNAHKPTPRRKHSGGPVEKREVNDSQREPKYDVLPLEDREPSHPGRGVAAITKTIVVRDERGQVVSVTKVAPDAKFGVGVKPKPGQTVKEYAEGKFDEDPFLQQQKERPVEPRPNPTKKKR